jgi:hypothetical protein
MSLLFKADQMEGRITLVLLLCLALHCHADGIYILLNVSDASSQPALRWMKSQPWLAGAQVSEMSMTRA